VNSSSKIKFIKIPIPTHYGKPINNIYFVCEKSGSSTVFDTLKKLDTNTQNKTRSIIYKMATVQKCNLLSISWTLKKYKFGEIKPKPYRFFFFKKYGNNIIFFDCIKKDQNSLGDKFYKKLQQKMEIYQHEFEKSISRD
jgi:hypothetical protein